MKHEPRHIDRFTPDPKYQPSVILAQAGIRILFEFGAGRLDTKAMKEMFSIGLAGKLLV